MYWCLVSVKQLTLIPTLSFLKSPPRFTQPISFGPDCWSVTCGLLRYMANKETNAYTHASYYQQLELISGKHEPDELRILVSLPSWPYAHSSSFLNGHGPAILIYIPLAVRDRIVTGHAVLYLWFTPCFVSTWPLDIKTVAGRTAHFSFDFFFFFHREVVCVCTGQSRSSLFDAAATDRKKGFRVWNRNSVALFSPPRGNWNTRIFPLTTLRWRDWSADHNEWPNRVQ